MQTFANQHKMETHTQIVYLIMFYVLIQYITSNFYLAYFSYWTDIVS